MLFLKLFLQILKTKIVYSRWAGELYSHLLYLFGLVFLWVNKPKAAFLIMRAHRNERSESWRIRLENTLLKHNLLQPDIIETLIPEKFRHEGFYHGRVFLLKEKKGNEKGVIIIKYNETFAKLFNKYDIRKILNDYYLCIELSYYGFCTPEILQFEQYKNAGVVIGLVHDIEERSLLRLCNTIKPVYYSSSTWVDERKYFDMGLEREYDCIMIAMWNNIKRHHLLFDAVRRMNDPTFKVCLVGGPWGLVLDDMKNLAKYYGVLDNIEFMERIPPDQVNLMLNKSKCNLLLSLKEGGNKAIIEGMFADVPAIILDEHIGVDLHWVNDQTGIVTSKNELKNALLKMRDTYQSYKPRQWALDNISCHASTRNLEAKLKEIAAKQNEPWTVSIVKKINRPELEYYHLDEKLPGFDYKKYEK